MAEFMCCWDRKKSKCVLSQRGCESAVPPIKSQSHRLAATCGGLLHHSPTPAEAAISTYTRNTKAVRIKPRRAAEAVPTLPDAGCPRVAVQLLTKWVGRRLCMPIRPASRRANVDCRTAICDQRGQCAIEPEGSAPRCQGAQINQEINATLIAGAANQHWRINRETQGDVGKWRRNARSRAQRSRQT